MLDWQYIKLSDVVKKGSSNLSIKKLENTPGNYPVFGAKGEVGSISTYNQESDYIGIIKDGAGIGRVFKLPKKSSILATLQYLIPEKGQNTDFLKYFLESIDFEDFRTGSTIPHIYFKDYKDIPYPDITLEEQKQIVEILDEAFAGIDQAIKNTEQNIKNARELFESYLNNIFTKKGEGWVEKKLNEICDVRDGTHDSPKYVENGIPFVTQKNIRSDGLCFEKTKFISETDHEKFYKRSNVSEGDIIISMIGANRGMTCLVDDNRIFSIKNVGLIKKTPEIKQLYLLYFLKSSFAKSYIEEESCGGAQPFIGLTKLRNFPIPLAPLKTQEKIVDSIKVIDKESACLIAIHQQKLAALKELKQSLLQKAFAGELTSNRQEAA